MAHTCAAKIDSLVVSVFIGILFILNTPAVLAQTPSFQPVVTYDPGGYQASSVAIADVNRDGKPDLIVTNCGACYGPSDLIGHAGSLGVLLGNGDGTFQPAVAYNSGGSVPIFVVVADVNGDGNPDLIVVNRNSNNIGVLLGNGDGTFQPAVTYESGSHSPLLAAVADVNGDGKPDLFVAHFCGSTNCDGLVGVLLGNGDGTFQPAVTYPSGGRYASAVAVADVNGDGKPDVLVTTNVYTCCDAYGAVGVLLGNGDGTFQPAVTYRSGELFIPPASSRLAVTDVNGDGRPDLIVENTECCKSANGAVSVLLGNGDATFQPVVTYKSGTGGWGTSVAVADVNGDGKPDIVATDQCAADNCINQGLVALLVGNGDGSFKTAQTYGSGGFLTNSVAVGDLNGDGKPDLVVANVCADDTLWCKRSSVGVLLNNTTEICATPPLVTISAAPTFLWPPNGRMAPVTVSGAITNSQTGCSIKTAAFVVKDEYGKVQPSGALTLGPGGVYSFTTSLQASRLGRDLDGRQYTITVGASNNAGKTGSQSGTVTVPRDLGH